ncbi:MULTISPECIES: PqqD family protein [unclassified Streptomyces]|uniref:PqqD family protein n=1 Tax=unclassified Streptomyces TaxID=2593676 RepID=UPI002E29F43E|nr:PqqD family protein [Streptomyces sp. NBC_00223]
MHDPRAAALKDLRAVLSDEDIRGAENCARRMCDSLPHQGDLRRNLILVAYGGGKDSSYTLAFARTVQLLTLERAGTTFRLRVATNRHSGMPRAVMENIDRTYTALRLHDDPDAELLLIDGRTVRPFAMDTPLPPEVVRRNRTDVLMTGHRTAGDGRSTFCNACNLSMMNSFGVAAGHGEGVDLIITGDSPQEQRDYYLWVSRIARRFHLQPPVADRGGVKGFLSSLDGIAGNYFQDIHGEDADVEGHRVASEVPRSVAFFSIFDHTDYASGRHWPLLTDLIGFNFDDLAFSFTESDCANPALMAHMRALKCERRYGRSYAEGILEYLGFALDLMRKKEFPDHLIDLMRRRYTGEDAVRRMRAAMDAYALDAYALTAEHLVAVTYAPFAEKGANLAGYLTAEQPDMADALDDLHALLAGDDAHPGLAHRLETVSGLTLAQLRTLYGKPLRLPVTTAAEGVMIDAILDGDPHKAVIPTRHTPNGPVVPELLSGR